MDERLLRILGGEEKYYPYGLENQFPRIFEKIMLLWDSPAINDYFTELMVPERQGRAGFPPDIAAEIVRLSLVHFSTHAPDKKQDVWAVSTDKFAIFKPPVNIKNENTWKPLPVAAAQAIERLGFPCSARGFHRAAVTGDRRGIALFLEAGVNTEITNERGWTPLMLAAFNGHDDVIKVLIKHRANVHASDLLGNTALHWAADSGQTSSTKLLIEYHAEIDAINNSGFTPLLQASKGRHLGVVLLLIDKGANLNATARDGSTALHKSAASGYNEIVRTLIYHGANTDIKNRDGDTPLTLAEKYNQKAIIKIIMSGSKNNHGGQGIT
ncbi:MAG: ankyrin repeat domain-containing protein [Gallionella sp.]